MKGRKERERRRASFVVPLPSFTGWRNLYPTCLSPRSGLSLFSSMISPCLLSSSLLFSSLLLLLSLLCYSSVDPQLNNKNRWMLNRWTYGWFGQPASIQTVQKSQDQPQPPLRTSQVARAVQQLDQQHAIATKRDGQSQRNEWKGNGENENSQVSADSFKTAPDGYGTTLANSHHQVRFGGASSIRPVLPSRNEIPSKPPHPPSRPPLRAPTISSNTMNRLKAQLSSRTLPPKSPPLQSIPDQPKNENRSEMYDIWPSPQPQNLPPPRHSFDHRNMRHSGRYGEPGTSLGDEGRERHRVCTEEWQDNRERVPSLVFYQSCEVVSNFP